MKNRGKKIGWKILFFIVRLEKKNMNERKPESTTTLYSTTLMYQIINSRVKNSKSICVKGIS